MLIIWDAKQDKYMYISRWRPYKITYLCLDKVLHYMIRISIYTVESFKLTLQTSLGDAVGLVWVDTVHIEGLDIRTYPSAPYDNKMKILLIKFIYFWNNGNY